jgi:hypothetical protein
VIAESPNASLLQADHEILAGGCFRPDPRAPVGAGAACVLGMGPLSARLRFDVGRIERVAAAFAWERQGRQGSRRTSRAPADRSSRQATMPMHHQDSAHVM